MIIKTFKTPLGNYFYDRETDSIVPVSTQDYLVLERISKGKESSEDVPVLERYKEKGLCRESKLSKIAHPADKALPFYLESRVEKITLQVTQNCNLRCSYCAYSGKYNQRSHSNKVMDFETMKQSIDFGLSRSYDSPTFNVSFYGGEPLLEISNIKKSIAYICEKYPKRKTTYSMTTNGTLLTDKNVAFLHENNVSVMISLDGPKEIHDKNRIFKDGTGSFDKIIENLEHIQKNYPAFFKRISFNTVIAPGSDYKCISDFFDATDIIEDSRLNSSPLSMFNLKESVTYEEQHFITYGIQRLKILLGLLGLYERNKVSKLFAKDFVRLMKFYEKLGQISKLPQTAHPGGPCIAGATKLFVDVNGNLYPCERVSEESEAMKIGHIHSGFHVEKARKILNVGQITEKECLQCWNFLHCGMCAASADNKNELSGKTRLSYCPNAKQETLAQMREICFLKEHHFDFTEEQING